MSFTFTATVCRKSGSFPMEATASVYQQLTDGSCVPVAYMDDSSDPADHRQTSIHFSEGVLHFAAAYDGPLRHHFTWPFTDEKHNDTGISLHHFPLADRAYLCSSEGFLPILKSCHPDGFQLRIYRASPVPAENGLSYSLLAAVMQTEKHENGFAYKIQLEEALPVRLLMAIFSLPFTLLNPEE